MTALVVESSGVRFGWQHPLVEGKVERVERSGSQQDAGANRPNHEAIVEDTSCKQPLPSGNHGRR